jgi:NACalpha-BTF3-like transcription factor
LRVALVMKRTGATRERSSQALEKENWKVDEAVQSLLSK